MSSIESKINTASQSTWYDYQLGLTNLPNYHL